MTKQWDLSANTENDDDDHDDDDDDDDDSPKILIEATTES